jgi:NAD-dependent dihydropyrimidine dehydrogenase PreA subunit
MDQWLLPNILYERCSGCSFCVINCPQNVVMMAGGRPEFIAQKECTYCGICEDICPLGAIQLTYQIMPLMYLK